MPSSTLIFRRGAPISLDLVVTDAGAIDPTTVTVQMDLKPSRGSGVPDADVAVAASFAIAWNAAAGAEPGYWRGTISALVSEGLAERFYAADAVLSVAGQVIDITDFVMIEIAGRVTAP